AARRGGGSAVSRVTTSSFDRSESDRLALRRSFWCSSFPGSARLRRGRVAVLFALEALVVLAVTQELLAQHGHFARSADADLHAVALHAEHAAEDIAGYHDPLVDLAREHEHRRR